MCGTAKTKNFVTESTEKGDFVFMKKQQWMSLLLAAAMAVSVLPAGAFAEEADEAAGGTQAAVVLEQEQTAPSTTEVQPAGTVSDETVPEANIGGEAYDTLEAAVALVNGEACADLQAAVGKIIELAQTGTAVTVVLQQDVNVGKGLTISEGWNVTLDLNGKAVTTAYNSENEKSAYAVSNYGTFTLKDAAGGGKITARGVQNVENGKMYMQSGEIVACDKNGGAAIWNEAELTMTGGTLRSSHEGTPYDTYGAGCLNNSGTALVTGGSFEGANHRTYAIISTGALTIRREPGNFEPYVFQTPFQAMLDFYDFFTREYGGIPAYLLKIGVKEETLCRLAERFVEKENP